MAIDAVAKQDVEKSLNKNQKKKLRKKTKRENANNKKSIEIDNEYDHTEIKVEIDYIPEPIGNFFGSHEFIGVIEKFKYVENSKTEDEGNSQKEDTQFKPTEVPIKARGFLEDEDDVKQEDEQEKPKLSKKKLKKLNRLSVAELKQLVARPDVVEMHDVTARDPKLLVSLKAARNSVPVPRHWCFKRKYLQGKRGIEKPPFKLPDFIRATGIMEMRQALQEKEEEKSLKSKMRERVRPKMGKIDIDYQKLHDAFFKMQTKPKLSIHGDIYYEGKEFETRLREKKPGNLSEELKSSLGMPVGHGAEKYPPPWLIAMQRYGPPPSYPNLKIPGLNAPIPDGCSFGYHPGGWGKPPVDESGKPLYGDVFGATIPELNTPQREEIDKRLWGEVESESEEESEEEEEKEEEEEPDMAGLVTPGDTGLTTPSGTTSVVTLGFETPESIELRKKRIEDAMDQGGDTPALFTVLPEKRANVSGAMMGSTHIYDMTVAPAALTSSKKSGGGEGIDIALNPEELDMDVTAMKAKYERTVKEQTQGATEDLSDMVAEHQAKQKKRKNKSQSGQDPKAKKTKEFKF